MPAQALARTASSDAEPGCLLLAVVCCLLQRTRAEAVFYCSQQYWVVSGGALTSLLSALMPPRMSMAVQEQAPSGQAKAGSPRAWLEQSS